MWVQPRKVVAIPMAAAHIKDESVGATAPAETPVQYELKALVTVKYDTKEYLKDMMFRWLDSDARTAQTAGVILQLVSTEVDPNLGKPKLSKETMFHLSRNLKLNADKVTHKVEFLVDANFGIPGAILVTNKYQKEFNLEGIAIEGLVHLSATLGFNQIGSSQRKGPSFVTKAYLPDDTPVELRKLREKELRQLRGNGEGLRTLSDRIYEYDAYSDLGYPDKGDKYVSLGGQNQPYPRRCRAGRPPTNSDVNAESPVNKYMPMYVPRDEAFEDLKVATITEGKWKVMLSGLIPTLKEASVNSDVIKTFSDIIDLYKKSSPFDIKSNSQFLEKAYLPRMLNKIIKEAMQDVFKFDLPKIISRDVPSFCLRCDEFGRLTLAGINPLSIERLKVQSY